MLQVTEPLLSLASCKHRYYRYFCNAFLPCTIDLTALRYKPEGRGFDSRLSNWNFSLRILRPHYGPGVDLAFNRDDYQEYFLGDKDGRCVGLTTLPPSCADCLEIWKPRPPVTVGACPGLYRDSFTFTIDLTRNATNKVQRIDRNFALFFGSYIWCIYTCCIICSGHDCTLCYSVLHL
jgi:hypothetical protein